MIDNKNLKALCEAAPTGPWLVENDSLYFKDDGYTRHLLDSDAGHDVEDEAYYAALKFIAAANPSAVLALLAENKRLSHTARLAQVWAQMKVHEEVGRATTNALLVMWGRDQLKAENEALKESHEQVCTNYNQVSYASEDRGKQIDQLRAEVAGLKTGYEAYERVNAELKAEVEGLRKLGPSKEIIWCACGDGYPVNSHGAGFMDANNGVCANCDAAQGQGEQS